jgi:hypothetical protein
MGKILWGKSACATKMVVSSHPWVVSNIKIGVYKVYKIWQCKKKMAPILGQRPMEPMAFEQPFSTEMILPNFQGF